mgnify:CR=1 FL=1
MKKVNTVYFVDTDFKVSTESSVEDSLGWAITQSNTTSTVLGFFFDAYDDNRVRVVKNQYRVNIHDISKHITDKHITMMSVGMCPKFLKELINVAQDDHTTMAQYWKNFR